MFDFLAFLWVLGGLLKLEAMIFVWLGRAVWWWLVWSCRGMRWAARLIARSIQRRRHATN